jgi:GTP-binding protein
MAGVNTQNTNLRISAGNDKQFPSDQMPQIALSGRSNVGKSSLINTLLGRKSLARVSSSPGKTITINFYDVDKKLFLVDLPGYGYAKRRASDKAVWSSLTDRFFTANKNIDRLTLVVQLIDSRARITNDDAMMLDFLSQTEIPYVVVVTKMDKLNKTERAEALAEISASPFTQGVDIIPFSSHSGEGKLDLWKYILSKAEL